MLLLLIQYLFLPFLLLLTKQFTSLCTNPPRHFVCKMNGVVQSNAKFYNRCVQTQVCWSPNVSAAFICHSLYQQQYNYGCFGKFRPHKLYIAALARSAWPPCAWIMIWMGLYLCLLITLNYKCYYSLKMQETASSLCQYMHELKISVWLHKLPWSLE